ncbi:MAG: NADP-dependent oxidoreductase [Burkholderiales bacterium]
MARTSAKTRAPVLPDTMSAAAIDRFGPPEVLTLHTLPVPDAGPRDVLIEMHAAGVGVWDAEVRDGSWRPYGRPRFPLVIGTDGAGVIVAKGSSVRRFNLGDRVWAYHYANPKGGFYAEYVAVDAARVGHVPVLLDLLQAGAGAVTSLTALQGIDGLNVKRSETVLVFGASGAVGTLAVQFAKVRNARVLGTASGRQAMRLVQELGADGVIDARSVNAIEQLRELAPSGVDAVLALAGGEALERMIDCVKTGGRVAYPNGVEPKPRRRDGIRTHAYDAEASPGQFARLGRTAAEARLRVIVAAAYPLAQAARAHERLERGHILGRIALRIRRHV